MNTLHGPFLQPKLQRKTTENWYFFLVSNSLAMCLYSNTNKFFSYACRLEYSMQVMNKNQQKGKPLHVLTFCRNKVGWIKHTLNYPCDIERQPACPVLASTPPDESSNQAEMSWKKILKTHLASTWPIALFPDSLPNCIVSLYHHNIQKLQDQILWKGAPHYIAIKKKLPLWVTNSGWYYMDYSTNITSKYLQSPLQKITKHFTGLLSWKLFLKNLLPEFKL